MMFGWTSGDIGQMEGLMDGGTDRTTTWFYECLDLINVTKFDQCNQI